ncbi:MAG TPA: NAD+ synthase [bacterium]|nr:MAG: Glutamine-dependent NAD(+) synthetase [bacterium ADurb.Bin270]HPW45082.1 NAD+ synthase [bacterium]HQC51164.1 NAD+ synthase [bacterium]HQG13980.1 NAD+ synthase [bacterium]HQH81029.1 NAD+ synthase [bacterium]
MKIAAAQINTTIGDFDGNVRKIIENIRRAKRLSADLVLFPELSVCGYPPKDLLEKPAFVEANLRAVSEIASATRGIYAVIGFVSINEGLNGRPLFNSAGLLGDGAVKFVQHKTLLPEYDVFDEARYFEPASKQDIFKVAGVDVGLTACDDMWSLYSFGGRTLYRSDPARALANAGVRVILNLSASPFTIGKQLIRRELITKSAQTHGVDIVYCNMVGGNDELVFDGRSFACNSKGRIVHECAAFREDFFVLDTSADNPAFDLKDMCRDEEVLQVLTLGLADYMSKCGFRRAVIGLSGGVDSAVVAAVACRAIGSENVLGVMMPSIYSSQESVTDSEKLARNLGMKTSLQPIGNIYQSYREALGYSSHTDVSLVEENIQARIRGNILMAISNREGALLISTGNKSELSTGYCTLYGDMAGGFALISDLPKTYVYSLARHINKDSEVIPNAIIEKPPSAELKPGQRDQDSLPPYDQLDPIITAYIEERLSVREMVAKGFDKDLVHRIVDMIDRNEYKRRQAAPGIKITSKAFGSGRRLPIAKKLNWDR